MLKLWLAPAGLHIEPARPEDSGTLARLHALGFYRGWPESDFSAYLADRAISAYVACDARRKIAGFAVFRAAGTEAELLTVAVDPRWRGKKIGRALLEAAFSDLRLSPVVRVFLEVEEGNGPAVALYRRLGFAEVGRRAAYYPKPDGTAATALVMARDLG